MVSSTPNSDSIIRATKAILKSREKKASHSKAKQVQRPVQGHPHGHVAAKTITPKVPVEHKDNHTERRVEAVVKSEGPRKLLMSDSSMSSDESDSEGELKIALHDRSPSTPNKGGKKGSKFKRTAPDGGLFCVRVSHTSVLCLH